MKYYKIAATMLLLLPSTFVVNSQELAKESNVNKDEKLIPNRLAGIRDTLMQERVILYRWSVEDVYRLALEKNPGIQAAASRINAARYTVEATKSNYLPKINAIAGYSHNNVASGKRHIGDDNTEAGFQVSWTIFDSGSRRLSVLLAQNSLEISHASHIEAQRILLRAVCNAFYNAALAQESMRIAHEDAVFNKLMLDESNIRRNVGAVDDSTVWNYEIKYGQAVASYVEAQKDWEISCITLSQLLAFEGKEIYNYLQLIINKDSTPSNKYNISEELARALRIRSDLKIAKTKVELAANSIRSAKAEDGFTIDATAGWTWSRDDSYNYSKGNQNLSAGIIANWNLFNGGYNYSNIRSKASEYNAVVSEHEDAILSVEAEINEIFSTLESNNVALKVQTEVYGLSLKLRDYVKRQFELGATTITRLNEVQTDLIKASASLSTAQIRVLQNYELIRITSGKIIEDEINKK